VRISLYKKVNTSIQKTKKCNTRSYHKKKTHGTRIRMKKKRYSFNPWASHRAKRVNNRPDVLNDSPVMVLKKLGQPRKQGEDARRNWKSFPCLSGKRVT